MIAYMQGGGSSAHILLVFSYSYPLRAANCRQILRLSGNACRLLRAVRIRCVPLMRSHFSDYILPAEQQVLLCAVKFSLRSRPSSSFTTGATSSSFSLDA